MSSSKQDYQKPNHYTKQAIQPLEYIMANDLGFIEGNIVKYITRHKDKNGIEDLEKARDYIDELIKYKKNQLTKPVLSSNPLGFTEDARKIDVTNVVELTYNNGTKTN